MNTLIWLFATLFALALPPAPSHTNAPAPTPTVQLDTSGQALRLLRLSERY